MPIIGPALHRVLDFVTVVVFTVAPSIFGLYPGWRSPGDDTPDPVFSH